MLTRDDIKTMIIFLYGNLGEMVVGLLMHYGMDYLSITMNDIEISNAIKEKDFDYVLGVYDRFLNNELM